MAGILKVDQVQSDSNLAFAIAGSNVAFMNATSLQMVGSNVSLAGTNVITNGKVVSSAQPVGAVLQVVNAVKVDVFSTSNTTYTDITGLSVSITPLSTSSKILVLADVFIGQSSTNNSGAVQIVGGSTVLGNNTSSAQGLYGYGAGGSLNDQYRAFTSASLSYLDSPATASSITYKIQIRSIGGTVYMNRWTLNTDIMGSSSITVMEIAA
jgi:hypothetical protein